MAVKKPDVFTEFNLNEVDLETPVFEETILKMAANNNLLLELLPVGSIMYLNDNQNGGGTPDPDVWQYCDGSEITNPNSPIRSIGIFQNFVPDLRDKYPRGANDEDNNSTGGSYNHSLAHSHGIGVAGGGGAGLDQETKGPGDRRHGVPHSHGLQSNFASPTVIESPKFFLFNAYMKVI